MNTSTGYWSEKSGWTFNQDPPVDANWILYFGTTRLMDATSPAVAELRRRFPNALCCGCSTSGEILQGSVTDDSVVAAVARFDHSTVRAVALPVPTSDQTRKVAADLARELLSEELAHILVLSDGLKVNGTQLATGFRDALPDHVQVTGGLAGDGTQFGKTLVGLNDRIESEMVVAIGFYGKKIYVSYGSEGGWESFGPKRRITRSRDNILFELDGQPALALYKRYLGDRAADLPATGLLYPLELLASTAEDKGLVRTILAVDEDQHSLTFAGDMPENSYARLMKTRHGGLISGAEQAGYKAANAIPDISGKLAVLVSCVGRRLVLGSRAVEELDAVQRRLGSGCATIGFYSYGELCPPEGSLRCELHNQTMTITVIAEAE